MRERLKRLNISQTKTGFEPIRVARIKSNRPGSSITETRAQHDSVSELDDPGVVGQGGFEGGPVPMALKDGDQALDSAEGVGVARAVEGIEQAGGGREHGPVWAGDLAGAALDAIGAEEAAGWVDDSGVFE